jgi:hypothetical protein
MDNLAIKSETYKDIIEGRNTDAGLDVVYGVKSSCVWTGAF